MNTEIKKTLDHCVEYATELLTETGEAYPFGAYIDTVGNVHPLEVEIDKRNIPTIGKVIDQLNEYCSTEMKEGRMHGYATCYEVGYQLEDDGEKQDAIAIDITHTEEKVPLYYLPFNTGPQMEIGELFAVKR